MVIKKERLIPVSPWTFFEGRWINNRQTQPQCNRLDIGAPLLKICTFNVLFDRCVRFGLKDPTFHAHERFQHTLNFLRDTEADIIGLQEVTPNFLRLLQDQEWAQRD